MTDYFAIIIWVLGMVSIKISFIKYKIIEENNLFPNKLNKVDRPWGLKNKELLGIAKNINDQKVKSKIRWCVYFRLIGYAMFIGTFLIVMLSNIMLDD